MELREEDIFGLDCHQELAKQYKICSDLFDPYLNIFGIFYHDLIRYITNFHLLMNSPAVYTDEGELPSVNTNYTKEPFPVKSTLYFRNLNYNKSILQTISQLLPLSKSITIGESISIPETQLYPKLISKYRIRFGNNFRIQLPDSSHQIQALKKFLEKYSCILGCDYNPHFINNFIDYVSMYISKDSSKISSDLLIVGSNAILSNRILSAKYLSAGKKVILIAHGGMSALCLDEPIIGYSETSYCTDIINFGSRHLETSKWNRSLTPQPKIHYAS